MPIEVNVGYDSRVDENGNSYTVKISETFIEVPDVKPLEQQAEELMAQLQAVLNQINNQNGI